METLTWVLPTANAVRPAFEALKGTPVLLATGAARPAFEAIKHAPVVNLSNVIDIQDFNTFVGAGVVWAITRFIVSYTRVPERVLSVIDMAFCGVVLYKLVEVVIEVYGQLEPVFLPGMKVLGGVS